MMDTKDEKQVCVADVMFETLNVQTEAQMIEISTMEDHLSPISLNHMKAKVYGHRDAVGLVHATVPTLCIDLTHRSWSSASIY